MLEVIISFIYIAVFCMCTGSGVLKVLGLKLKLGAPGITARIVTGIITLTVAVGWISIFARIGIVVHIVMLILAAASAVYARDEIRDVIYGFISGIGYADLIAGAGVLLLIAYAASRGDFHTDTGIYHAAAIRVYEEYGSITGIVNVQPHYGYNSSYLGFAALFTLSRILPYALHTTTGFMMALFTLDVLYHLRDIRTHRSHVSDAAGIAIILYVFMNLTGTISPATDYGTMLMTGYFLCAWLRTAEREESAGPECTEAEGQDCTDIYALLSVYGLFLATMKLSSAMCVLVVILPLIRLIRARAWSRIGIYLGLGLFSFLFYIIRNIKQTGWLFYPFESIDLFDVEWKFPKEYSLIDSGQIKVWGRCLFDVDKIDWPVSKWLPIWWEAQEHYDQMLIYALFIGALLVVVTAIVNKRLRPAYAVFYMMCAANLAVWFVAAPFIRYGLCFILAIPLMGIAGLADAVKDSKPHSLIRYVTAASGVLICLCLASRADHYLMDDLVFIKHHLADPYYVIQRPFEDVQMGVEYLGDARVPIYYTDNDEEKNSYYTPLSTCYYWMLERVEPMGDTVQDGFKAK
ncbi:MAG: hypothetical protein K5673_07055 [Lachnospiraceae bacterium]|nr:hypothetical protein [Lachnospiraceae bacterium]